MSSPEGPIVVFDLDGVLIDSAQANVQAFNHGLKQVGKLSTDEEILSLVGLPAVAMLTRLGCPEEESERVFQDFVRPFYVENLPELANAYEGARDVLLRLKDAGYAILSCTSGDRLTQTAALKAIGLWDLIELMQTPDDSQFGKPDPRYIQELLARYSGTGPVHHVEDSEVGLQMGRDAGATTYYASYGNGALSGKVEPDFILQSIGDLPQALGL